MIWGWFSLLFWGICHWSFGVWGMKLLSDLGGCPFFDCRSIQSGGIYISFQSLNTSVSVRVDVCVCEEWLYRVDWPQKGVSYSQRRINTNQFMYVGTDLDNLNSLNNSSLPQYTKSNIYLQWAQAPLHQWYSPHSMGKNCDWTLILMVFSKLHFFNKL